MADPAAELREIARRISRLQQDWSDPRRFHDRRDSLAEEILGVAAAIGNPRSGDRR